MPRNQPEVMAGMRPPQSTRLKHNSAGEPIAEPTQVDGFVPETVEGTLYVSRFAGYRVQVTAPVDVVDPTTGQRSTVRPYAAQFVDGKYVNKHRDPAMRKLIDATLQRNERFGAFGSGSIDFWLASDQNAHMTQLHIDNAKRTLRSLPAEAVEQFMAELKQGDAADHKLSQSQNP